MLSVKQVGIKYHFGVFGMIWPGIETRCHGPFANTQTIMQKLGTIAHTITYMYHTVQLTSFVV